LHPRRLHLLLYPDYIVSESTVGVLVGQCRADRGSPCAPISAAAPPHLMEHLPHGTVGLMGFPAQNGDRANVPYSFNDEDVVQTLDRLDLPDLRDANPIRPQ